MRIRKMLIAAAVVSLAIPAFAAAAPKDNAPTGYKVTGGGQIIAEGVTGPGNTVGFNAQELQGGTVRGQFQYVPRNANEDSAQTKFHGVVTCLEDLGDNAARFGGYFRSEPSRFFTVDVTDGGQGAEGVGDMILVRETTASCADRDEDEQPLLLLGRGNVKIHNDQ